MAADGVLCLHVLASYKIVVCLTVLLGFHFAVLRARNVSRLIILIVQPGIGQPFLLVIDFVYNVM